MHLLTEPSAQSKANKSKDKAAVYMLHLWPNNRICQYADGCMEPCLKSAGRGRFKEVRAARYRRTKLFYKDPEAFAEKLRKDLKLVTKRMVLGTKSKYDGLKAYVRLNGTSDIEWEEFDSHLPSYQLEESIIEAFPDIEFYDYTKNPYRDISHLPNYSLTFSRSANNDEHCKLWLKEGRGNVAVVFNGELPNEFWGYPVIDGDANDLRPLDPKPCIVGLKAKGKAKADESGFVIHA